MLIYGKPALTPEEVRSWNVSLSHEGASKIALELTSRRQRQVLWHPAFARVREDDKGASNLRGIADALSTLTVELPLFVNDYKRLLPNQDTTAFDLYLELTAQLAPMFEPFAGRGRGRRRDPANAVAIMIRKLVQDLYEKENPGKRLTAKERTAFVAQAMAWLDVKRTDTAVERTLNRNRAGQK